MCHISAYRVVFQTIALRTWNHAVCLPRIFNRSFASLLWCWQKLIHTSASRIEWTKHTSGHCEHVDRWHQFHSNGWSTPCLCCHLPAWKGREGTFSPKQVPGTSHSKQHHQVTLPTTIVWAAHHALPWPEFSQSVSLLLKKVTSYFCFPISPGVTDHMGCWW